MINDYIARHIKRGGNAKYCNNWEIEKTYQNANTMELQFGCARFPALNISSTGLWKPVPCKVLPTPQPTANRSIWEAAAGLETISEESPSSSCNLQRVTSRLSTITLESSKACIHTSRVHNAGIQHDKARLLHAIQLSDNWGESLNSVWTPSDFESAGR